MTVTPPFLRTAEEIVEVKAIVRALADTFDDYPDWGDSTDIECEAYMDEAGYRKCCGCGYWRHADDYPEYPEDYPGDDWCLMCNEPEHVSPYDPYYGWL